MTINSRLYIHNKIQMIKLYLLNKLLKQSSIEREVYKDILNTFNNGNKVFRIYIKNAPIGELDLQQYLSNYSDWKHSDRDLEVILNFIIYYLESKFAFNRMSIRMYKSEDGYFEVHNIK